MKELTARPVREAVPVVVSESGLRAQAVRDDRYWGVRSLRATFRGTSETSLRVCGHLRGGEDVEISDEGGKRAISGGVKSCRWVGGCPRCRVPVAMRRATLVAAAVARWHVQGGRAYLLTLAPPHRPGDALDFLTGRLGKTWSEVLRGHSMRRWLGEMGVVARVRVTEITVSLDRGWHPHFHVVLFVEGDPLDDEDEADFQYRLGNLFHAQMFMEMDRTGLLRPDEHWSPVEGVDLVAVYDPVALATYLQSVSVGEMMGVGMEVADPGGKTGKSGRSIPAHEVAVQLGRRWRAAGGTFQDLMEHDLEARAWRDRLRDLREGTKGQVQWLTTQGILRRLVPELDDKLTEEQLIERAQEMRCQDRELWQTIIDEVNAVAGIAPHVDDDSPFDDDQASGIPVEHDHDLPEPDPAGPVEVAATATVRVAADIAWLYVRTIGAQGGEWMTQACRLVERAGPLRAAETWVRLWNEQGGRRARAWVKVDGTVVRVGTGVGTEAEWWDPDPDTWIEMDVERLAAVTGRTAP